MEHELFMREAMAEARKAAALGEAPIGAVVVRDGAIISRGHNYRELGHDPTAHAEIIAIREAARAIGAWRLLDCTLYVTLEPCSMCAGAMVQARLLRLVYAAHDPKAGAAGSVVELLQQDVFNHKVEVISGILADESSQLLKQFFQDLRSRK